MQTILTITLMATAIMLIVTTNRLRSTRRSISDVLKDTAKTQEINSQLTIDIKVWEERYKRLETTYATFVSEFEQYTTKKNKVIAELKMNLKDSQDQATVFMEDADFKGICLDKERNAHRKTKAELNTKVKECEKLSALLTVNNQAIRYLKKR